MSGDGNLTQTAYGSYVQLNTFDEKENEFIEEKTSYPTLLPYKRCLCTKRDTILVLLVTICACILIIVSLALGLPKIHEKRQQYFDVSFEESPSPLLSYSKAVVVSDGVNCSDIGKVILLKNGSAVDAALAALFCGGVVNPHSMGLGGGFLMTVYLKENLSSSVIDARETAPLNSSKTMFDGNQTLAREGGLSIAVPGELRGYAEAHKRFGSLPWEELIKPSIQLCTHGFKVSAHLAKHLQEYKDKILSDESLRVEFFNNATNDVYKEGEILKRPNLGITLSEIASKGAEVLYTGDLHEAFLKDIESCGGIITKEDLLGYKPLTKPAVAVEIETPELFTLHTVPPPGSGLILVLILNILRNYNITAKDFKEIDDAVLMYHRISEAFKFAFAHRSQMGDSAFVNITQLMSNLQSKEYANSLWHEISDKMTHPVKFYKPMMETVNDHGTAQVSVLAENGDAVSVTSSINSHFGSLCLSSSTGIILNNGMDDFASPNITNYFGVPPSPANYISPGKRPLSSMSPTILVNSKGDVHMVAGGAGGTRIITASALAMIRNLWLGEDIKVATDAPRFHHQLFPNAIQYENKFPQVYLDKLKEYGHSVQEDQLSSVFLGIVRNGEKLQTNVDYRKGGSVNGY